MSQSIITFADTTTMNLDIQELTDENDVPINESLIIPDPTDYDTPNSVLVHGGHLRRQINIKGYCSNANKLKLRTAYNECEQIEPDIYPPPNSTTNITNGEYYYITKFVSTYKKGNDNVWYNMSIVYGGES